MRLTASELGLPFWSVLDCFLPSLAPGTVDGGGGGCGDEHSLCRDES